MTSLLPALPGLSVARSACEVFSGANVLLGCDSALTFRPLLLPRLHTHLRLHLMTCFVPDRSLLVPTPSPLLLPAPLPEMFTCLVH